MSDKIKDLNSLQSLRNGLNVLLNREKSYDIHNKDAIELMESMIYLIDLMIAEKHTQLMGN